MRTKEKTRHHRSTLIFLIFFKDEDKIFKGAASKLAGKPYGISYQFPQEITEKKGSESYI